MKMLSFAIGVTLMVLSVILGLYLGIWVCFIGGIVSVIEGAKASPIDAVAIAIGVFKFLVSGLVGWGSFILSFFIGTIFCGAPLIRERKW